MQLGILIDDPIDAAKIPSGLKFIKMLVQVGIAHGVDPSYAKRKRDLLPRTPKGVKP
jgi:hypothetical protein